VGRYWHGCCMVAVVMPAARVMPRVMGRPGDVPGRTPSRTDSATIQPMRAAINGADAARHRRSGEEIEVGKSRAPFPRTRRDLPAQRSPRSPGRPMQRTA